MIFFYNKELCGTNKYISGSEVKVSVVKCILVQSFHMKGLGGNW